LTDVIYAGSFNANVSANKDSHAPSGKFKATV
jgi:hypothetical protein